MPSALRPLPPLLPLRAAAAASLLMAPVLAWQGRRVRRTVPQLPDAAGPIQGEAGDVAGTGAPDVAGAAPLALLVVGESTAAGMGAATHADALTGHTASALARLTGRPVRWHALGRSGATARDAVALVRQARTLAGDVAVVALGVNDVLRFRLDTTWTRDLAALVAALRERLGPALPVVLAAVPPMGRFPALPQPLRAALGLRARMLDVAAARWAARVPGVAHAPVAALGLVATEGLFAPDGFHPSSEGYRQWGEALGGVAAGLLGVDGSTIGRPAA